MRFEVLLQALSTPANLLKTSIVTLVVLGSATAGAASAQCPRFEEKSLLNQLHAEYDRAVAEMAKRCGSSDFRILMGLAPVRKAEISTLHYLIYPGAVSCQSGIDIQYFPIEVTVDKEMGSGECLDAELTQVTLPGLGSATKQLTIDEVRKNIEDMDLGEPRELQSPFKKQ